MADKNIATLDVAGSVTGAELAVVIQGGQPVLLEIDAIAARTDLSGKADASALAGYLPTSQKGAANGVAPLGSDSKVPSTYLPSYVDDVIEAASQAAFPATGETGKIYIDTSTTPAAAYRWTGSAYSVIGGTPQYASQADAVAGTENTKTMTALRVAQAVDPKFALKADAITAASTVTSGTTLTRVAATGAPTGHYNRPLDCAGGTLTCGGTPVLNDVATVLNTHASTALTLTGSGVTVTAAAGKIAELVYNGSAWVDPSSAVASSAVQRLTATASLPVTDAATASTAETVVLEGMMPALSAGSKFDLDFSFDTPSAGTGTAVYKLRLGGSIGSGLAGSTTVDISPALAECGRWRLGFANCQNALTQAGGPLVAAVYGANAKGAGAYRTSVDTSAATRWALTITKSVAGDTKNIVAATPVVTL